MDFLFDLKCILILCNFFFFSSFKFVWPIAKRTIIVIDSRRVMSCLHFRAICVPSQSLFIPKNGKKIWNFPFFSKSDILLQVIKSNNFCPFCIGSLKMYIICLAALPLHPNNKECPLHFFPFFLQISHFCAVFYSLGVVNSCCVVFVDRNTNEYMQSTNIRSRPNFVGFTLFIIIFPHSCFSFFFFLQCMPPIFIDRKHARENDIYYNHWFVTQHTLAYKSIGGGGGVEQCNLVFFSSLSHSVSIICNT